MKVEIGKRYRFEPDEVCVPSLAPETVEVSLGVFGYGPVVRLVGAGGGVVQVLDDGDIPGIGRLVELGPEPQSSTSSAKLPPVFRHDAEEHRRLQNLFRNERDVTLGTGH